MGDWAKLLLTEHEVDSSTPMHPDEFPMPALSAAALAEQVGQSDDEKEFEQEFVAPIGEGDGGFYGEGAADVDVPVAEGALLDVEPTLDHHGFESNDTDAEDDMWDFVDVTETQVPFTEACKANMVRVRAVELGGGIEIRSACSSKSGWVSVDSSEVVLPPRQGCRLQISQDLYKGTRKWQVWYPRNKGDVHESHSITGQENRLQECMDWAWKRHEAAWVSLFHICFHSYIVYMKKASWTPSQAIERVSLCLDLLSFLTYIHKQIHYNVVLGLSLQCL